MKGEVLAPQSFRADGQEVTFSRLHQVFSQSPGGEACRREVRFGTFAEPFRLEARLREVIGDDIDGLAHHWVTVLVTEEFLRHSPPEEFNERERELLLLTAVTHDWCEWKLRDVSLPKKTAKYLRREGVINAAIGKRLFPGEENRELQELIREVSCEVLNRKDTKLGRAFSVIEQIGYFKTGIRAWEAVLGGETASVKEETMLLWLASRVVPFHLGILLGEAGKYAGVRAVLQKNSEGIGKFFEKFPKEIYEQEFPEQGEGERAWETFEASQKGWEMFI